VTLAKALVSVAAIGRHEQRAAAFDMIDGAGRGQSGESCVDGAERWPGNAPAAVGV
jgi:hypothetical protein